MLVTYCYGLFALFLAGDVYIVLLPIVEIKSAFYSKKVCYAHQRTRKTTMFKRRNLFEHCSVSPFGRQVCNQGTSKGPAKGTIKFEESDSLSASHGGWFHFKSSVLSVLHISSFGTFLRRK